MKIVYLDQNKWIELARVAHGRSESPELRKVLESVREARYTAEACFPLSFGHYVETRRRKNAQSRARLANFMLELSQCRTLAHDSHVLQHELDEALRSRFPDRVKAEQMIRLDLLGSGVSHAGGYPPFTMPATKRSLEALGITDEDARQVLERLVEFTALTGLTALGREIPDGDFAPTERRFGIGLGELQNMQLSSSARENLLYFRAMEDIRPSLIEALARHGMSLDEIKNLGEKGLRGFLEDLPSVKLDIHLHRQWAKNRDLRVERSDGYDFSFVGSAVNYCDVVVTEKQLANLLEHDAFKCRAQVLTSLRALPGLLVSGN